MSSIKNSGYDSADGKSALFRREAVLARRRLELHAHPRISQLLMIAGIFYISASTAFIAIILHFLNQEAIWILR